MVDDQDNSDPNSIIELYEEGSTTPIEQIDGIDSDGRFGVFPPHAGNYSVVGILSATQKVIYQNIEFTEGVGQNIGN